MGYWEKGEEKIGRVRNHGMPDQDLFYRQIQLPGKMRVSPNWPVRTAAASCFARLLLTGILLSGDVP